MTSLKRVGIILLVAILLIALSQSYVVASIKDRAIAIGIGIDVEEDQYVATLEVLSASGSENAKQVTKLLTGKGQSLSLCMQNVYEQTGQLPSLGQCCIVLLGKSFYQNVNVREGLAYLLYSDAFKDGTLIAAFDGKASDALTYCTALNGSASFSLSQQIQASDESTAIPRTFLEQFMNKQFNGCSNTAIMNFVTCTLKGEKDKEVDKEIAEFDCTSSVVFKQYHYVTQMTKEQQRGYNMLLESKAFDTFSVVDTNREPALPNNVILGIASKDCETDVEWKDGKTSITVNCKLRVERLRTDNTGHLFDILAKTDDKIDDELKQQVTEQVKQKVNAALAACKQSNADFLRISDSLYRKYGLKWRQYAEANPAAPYDTLTVKYNVTVS